MPRPSKGRRVRVTLRLTPDLVAQIDALCAMCSADRNAMAFSLLCEGLRQANRPGAGTLGETQAETVRRRLSRADNPVDERALAAQRAVTRTVAQPRPVAAPRADQGYQIATGPVRPPFGSRLKPDKGRKP